MKKSELALEWLSKQHGWQNDAVTAAYVDRVLSGYAAHNFTDQSLIICAGGAVRYWGK